ncbi:histidinol phosphate aminotransferase [Chryseobacterium sp. Leaf180]|uniref:histidinol-phosphate transaminase n=1 Tax=Chryseobacterium sp. Leaf180 TaxID=1736289 RepID=UPI0006F5A8FC|nr:histidinol-phosphate transaminase [Chryseobacterium sp. Leaf180]KQR94658.1 histidinol phosphate aminotransferase [Chryseobacterium sp. Leaf180]
MRSFDIEKLVRKNILNLKPYVSFRDESKLQNAVYLDANESPFGKLNRYPDSTQKDLKQKLSLFKNISVDQIALGNGSDELIDLIIKIFCEPKVDTIMVMNPSFSMYSFYAEINETHVIKLDLDENFQIKKELFLKISQENGTKIFFICSPNNPTGNTIENIEFYLENFNGIVVVDEAYIEFSNQPSAINLLRKYSNLIVMQTFSKAWGMAGARVGTAYASSEIIQLINKIKPPYNVNTMSQEEVSEALDNVQNFQSNVREILAEKEWLERELKNMKAISKIYPSEANFFLTEFNDAENVYQNLINSQILTSKRSPQIKNCIRITVGTRAENEKLLAVLKNI